MEAYASTRPLKLYKVSPYLSAESCEAYHWAFVRCRTTWCVRPDLAPEHIGDVPESPCLMRSIRMKRVCRRAHLWDRCIATYEPLRMLKVASDP